MKHLSLLPVLLAACFALAAGETPEPTGIYLVVRRSSFRQVEEAAKLPWIDGFTFYLGVKILTPEKGVYDWELTDKLLKIALENGKKVNLGFLPGQWVPDWFYGEGVKKFRLRYETTLVNPGKYDVAAPVPWDPVLLRLLGEIYRETGKRYAAHPAVASIQVTGPSLTNGLEANFTATPAEAAALGYTPEKLIDAWAAMFDAAAEAFPGQRLNWCIHDIYPGKRDPMPGRTVRDRAFRKYGKRLHLLACYLTHKPWFSPGNQAFDIWAERNREIPSGLQLINIYSTSGQTPAEFEQALRTGIGSGADYLEIFIEELSNPAYAAVVEKVRNSWKGLRK